MFNVIENKNIEKIEIISLFFFFLKTKIKLMEGLSKIVPQQTNSTYVKMEYIYLMVNCKIKIFKIYI